MSAEHKTENISSPNCCLRTMWKDKTNNVFKHCMEVQLLTTTILSSIKAPTHPPPHKQQSCPSDILWVQLLTPFPVTLQMQHIRSPEGVQLQQTVKKIWHGIHECTENCLIYSHNGETNHFRAWTFKVKSDTHSYIHLLCLSIRGHRITLTVHNNLRSLRDRGVEGMSKNEGPAPQVV